MAVLCIVRSGRSSLHRWGSLWVCKLCIQPTHNLGFWIFTRPQATTNKQTEKQKKQTNKQSTKNMKFCLKYFTTDAANVTQATTIIWWSILASLDVLVSIRSPIKFACYLTFHHINHVISLIIISTWFLPLPSWPLPCSPSPHLAQNPPPANSVIRSEKREIVWECKIIGDKKEKWANLSWRTCTPSIFDKRA